jgi:2-methylcitrate dehydratase PrpD
MNPDLADRIGQWATSYRPAPAHAARIRASVRDFAGCVAAGARRPELRAALSLAHAGCVPVWGLERSFDAASAALVMGTAGSLLQLHDLYVPAGLHPGSTVIPAAWSALHSPLRAGHHGFVAAVAAGYEAANRFGAACAPGQALAGSAATGTAGAIGAAVASALLHGLGAHGIARAVANAALLLPATPSACMRAHGAMVPLHSGIAARAGYEAACLAADGGAGRAALEGDATGPGLMQLLRGDPARLSPEAWRGETLDDICWKFYPACFGSLVAIEAALQPRFAGVAAIETATLRLPDRMLALVGRGPHSSELYDRLMSLRWSVAYALRHGRYDAITVIDADANANANANANADDEATLALAQRIEIVHAPELDQLLPRTVAADVTVQLQGRTLHCAYRRDARADPAAPAPRGSTFTLDDAALLAKFSALTRGSPGVLHSLSMPLAA